jgi:threonine dehydrogenase-like Zn-dependent dehydrogenase
MRAAVLRNGVVTVRETPDPIPGEGQLLVRTISTAICASDIHYMDHPEVVRSDISGMFVYDPDRDVVMGHEFVCEVVALGAGCSGQFPPGTRVTSIPALIRGTEVVVIGQHPDAPGSFGELMLLSEVMTRAVPETARDDAVALVDAFAVGEFYVRRAAAEPIVAAFVIGAGAIGLSAVAALASRGIGPIVVADFHPERRALAGEFGADIVVDPTTSSAYDLQAELAGEKGVGGAQTAVFECVGKAGLLQDIIDNCLPGSRVFAAGGWYSSDSLSVVRATKRGVSVLFGGGPEPQDWYGTLDAVIDGRLDPLPSIGRTITLDELPDALDVVRRGQGPPRITLHPNA